MSKFFEKKNPDATIKSVMSSMATGGVGMLLGMWLAGEFQRKGVFYVLLGAAVGSVLAGVFEWQLTPWSTSKDDTGKWSTTTTVIVAALILMGIIWELCRRIF